MLAFAKPACRQAGEMYMIGHDNKCVKLYAIILDKEVKAVNYDILVLIMCQ
jgi:hypothetical protein